MPVLQEQMADLQAALSRTEEFASQAQSDCTLLKQVQPSHQMPEYIILQMTRIRYHLLRMQS